MVEHSNSRERQAPPQEAATYPAHSGERRSRAGVGTHPKAQTFRRSGPAAPRRAGGSADAPPCAGDSARESTPRGRTGSPGATTAAGKSRSTGPSRRAAVIRNAPVGLGIVAMIAFFVWVCLQMASHALGGDALPAGIFGAAAAGALAAVAGLLHR